MPNWKKVIVSGSDAVLNSLNVTTALTASGLIYPTVDGTANQVIQTDGLGNLSFGSVDTTYEVVKNVAGTTLYKGTPVHATASNALGNVVGIIAASASNPDTMPATFILNEDLADEAEGYAIISGLIQGVDTSAFEEGDVVYVGENSGYTNVKPTGSNLIQNLGIVTKIHPSNGAGIVLGAGRSNDVPNLLSGEVFWGENNRSIQKPLAHILSGSSYTYSGSFVGDGSGLTGIIVSGSVEWDAILNKPSGIVSSSAQLSNTTIPGNLTIEGKLTAQEFHTEYVSASIIYESGSTQFGDTLDDTHTFIGTVDVSGSVSIDGKIALNDGGNSVYIGDNAGLNDDKSDNRNVGIGHQALYSNTTGNSNIANGRNALYSNTTGGANTANGFQALYSNTTGYQNTANGYQTLNSNTTGINNVANGHYSLSSNTTGNQNTANGYYSLAANTTGINNVANGPLALFRNTTGYHNTANGSDALYSNTTGYYNTANGSYALNYNTTGVNNTANGYYALPFLATGSNNIGEGYQAGSYQVGTTDPLTEVNNSVFIGYNTKGTLSATNENVFGYAAEGNGSNSVTIGNTSVTKTIINGNLGLGTTSPSARLEIQSSTVPTLMLRKEGNTGYALISGSSDLGFEFKTYDNGVVDAMKITKDGKVGIGTTSPSHKLDVAGNVLVTTSGSTQPLKTFEATYKQFSVDYPNSPSIYTTELNFGLYGRIQYNGNGGILSIVNRSTQAGSSSMRFVMGTTERMRITDTGNVGIGTTSPSSKLHVSGSGGGSDVLLVEPAGAPTISLKSSSTLTDYSGLHVGNKYLLITKNSGAIFQNIQGGLRFANGFAAKSVITENGYFGIGFNTTTGIDYPLDVKGDARISGSGNFTDGLTVTGSLVVQNPTVSNRYLKLGWGSIIGNDTQSEVSIYSHGGSLTASTIFVNGNNKPTNPAGISLRANGGVAIYGGNHLSEFTPSARLHVSGSGIFTDGLTVTGSINQTGDLTVDGIITAREFHTEFVSSSIIYESGSTKFGDTSDDVHHFTGSIQQSGSNSYFLGNVGIGTTSPQQLLDITATTTAPVLRLSRNENINSTLWAGESLGDIEFYTNDPSNPNVFGKISVVGGSGSGTPHSGYPDGHMVFFTAGQQGGSLSEKMRITDEGNVGIGTTSPSHKLDIAGDVRILSSSLSYQENIDVDSAATEVVATVSISDYDAAFFDYVIKSGTNLRAGTVTAVHNGTSVEYNEVSTQDLGTTTGVTLSVDISGTDLRLLATTTTDNWTVKSLVKTL